MFYTFWFEKNLQGDIVAVYNETGTKLISYAYDAWGNFRTTTHNHSGTNAYAAYNPFRYRGYYYDDFYGCLDDGYGRKIGFYYLNSRYYNPQWGRFINADGYVSTGTGLLGYNMFAYCNNNPVMYVDPNGDNFKDWAKKILKDTGENIKKISNTIKQTVTDLANSITIDIGFGAGIGGSGKIEGFEISAIVRTDFITFYKDSGSNINIGIMEEEYISVEGLHSAFQFGNRDVYSFDRETTYYSEYMTPDFNLVSEFGGSFYLGYGFTFKIGIDWEYFINQTIARSSTSGIKIFD